MGGWAVGVENVLKNLAECLKNTNKSKTGVISENFGKTIGNFGSQGQKQGTEIFGKM